MYSYTVLAKLVVRARYSLERTRLRYGVTGGGSSHRYQQRPKGRNAVAPYG